MTRDSTVVIATLGSIGDLLPFLAVGKTLRRRGHHVVLATHDEYESAGRMLGFEFCGIWDGHRSKGAFRDVLTSRPADIWARVWREFFLPAMRPTYEAVSRLARPPHSVVLAPWSAIGARLASEQRGIPFCSVYLSPHALHCGGPDGESHDELISKALNGLRQELGLSTAEQGVPGKAAAGGECIAFFPSWFGLPQPDRPDGAIATGFPLYDDALVPLSMSSLRRFLDGGDPPVVFTPGSFMDQAGAFFTDALDVCHALGRRAIFLTPHRRQIPSDLPESVLHLDYVPLHRILGRAAVLVHHGGIGTCAQAMRAGVPQVVTPIFFDQFDNAERIEQLGAGFAVDRTSLNAGIMAEAISRALLMKSARAHCSEVSARFLGEDPAETICDRIEHVATRSSVNGQAVRLRAEPLA